MFSVHACRLSFPLFCRFLKLPFMHVPFRGTGHQLIGFSSYRTIHWSKILTSLIRNSSVIVAGRKYSTSNDKYRRIYIYIFHLLILVPVHRANGSINFSRAREMGSRSLMALHRRSLISIRCWQKNRYSFLLYRTGRVVHRALGYAF